MKKMVIYLCIIFLVICIPTATRASIMDDVINGGKSFLENHEERAKVDETKFKEVSSDIYNILLYSGVALSVIIGAILGIQFIVASAEDKAKVKEALIPYVIGCVVTFGAFGFWKLAIEILNTV